jgi:hypothetical protein
MDTIPPLDRFSGSWIAVCRKTGRNVFETFNEATARRINQERYEVLTARDALARLNR